MSLTLEIILSLVGLAMIAVLLWAILRMLGQERRFKKERAEVLERVQSQAQTQRDHLIESVHVIARAMHDEQCGLTEGCIRIKVLLDNLAPHLLDLEPFSIFRKMFDATSHMPILDDWKKLKLQQRFKYTQERESLESKHRAQILDAASILVGYAFTQ
jgi:hypothetical protein